MQRWPLGRLLRIANIAIPTTGVFMRSRSRAHLVDQAITCNAGEEVVRESEQSIRQAAQLLNAGSILAVKGLGGYHLACDARNQLLLRLYASANTAKKNHSPLMAEDLEVARS